MNIDLWHLNGDAGNATFRSQNQLAVLAQADVKTGTTHVHCYQVGEPRRSGDFHCTHHTAGRAGEQGPDRKAAGFDGAHQTAVRLHHLQGCPKGLLCDAILKLVDQTPDGRHNIGVDDRGGTSFVFPELG